MKFYPNQIDLMLSALKFGKLKCIFLYGSDKNLMLFIISKIKECFEDYKEVDYNSAEDLISNIQSIDLFRRKSLKLINYKKDIDPFLKSILDVDMVNFPLIISEELNQANQSRKLFEDPKNKTLGILGCYKESEINIKNFTLSFLSSKNKYIEKNALEYLVENVDDRFAILNELEKLMIFTEGFSEISMNDVKNCIPTKTNFEIDKLCFYLMELKFEKYMRCLDEIIASGTFSEMLFVRSLIRYYSNIFMIKKSGLDFDAAIAKLNIKIFFLYLERFKTVVLKSEAKYTEIVLDKLLDFEMNVKNNQSNSKFYKLGLDLIRLSLK